MLTFTFEGYSADDTDQMVFAFNGDTLFNNKIAAVGDVVHETVVADQIYRLDLRNNSAGDTWSSNSALNWDGLAHLASTSTFSDFHLGAASDVREHWLCACQRLLFRLGRLAGARGR